MRLYMRILTAREAAKIIAQKTKQPISLRQVQQEIKDGHIKAEKKGGMYWIKESDLNHYERRHPGVQGRKR